MTTTDFTHLVFVDLENVPEIDLEPMEGVPVHVTLFIGKKQTKVGVALFRVAHRLADQVALVEVGASGHNALDLVLASYLGRAAQRVPGGHFWIVSKDQDFDPLIGHLMEAGTNVARCDSFAALPFLPKVGVVAAAKSASTSPKTLADKRARLIARLRNPASRNRPSSEKALLAHIKTSLSKDASEATVNGIVRELTADGTLTIEPTGRISWK